MSVLDFGKVCRACLSSEKDKFISLETLATKELFEKCTLLKIDTSDGLPLNICTVCLSKCELWNLFKLACESSEATLKAYQQQQIETFAPDIIIKDEPCPTNYLIYVIQEAPAIDRPVETKIFDVEKNTEAKDSKNQATTSYQANFECEICQKPFVNKQNLLQHIRSHNNVNKQYLCQAKECGRSFKYAESLNLHMKVHENISQFICNICGKSFVQLASLKSHMLVHSEFRPFECDECHKRYKNQNDLKEHQVRHEQFGCELCEKRFESKSGLKSHLRSHKIHDLTQHKTIKRFDCNHCDKQFKFSSKLKIHLRSHTAIKSYPKDNLKKDER